MEREIRLAYFAGLLDGEAYFGLMSKGSRSPTAGKEIVPCIHVSMSCEKTIRALHEFFGAGGVYFIKRAKPHHKDQWRWKVTYNKARAILEEVRPYLITKAGEADRVINHPRGKRGAPLGNRRAVGNRGKAASRPAA